METCSLSRSLRRWRIGGGGAISFEKSPSCGPCRPAYSGRSMHIRDIFAARRPTFSFEFFPPKTAEGSETLFTTIRQLEAYKPAFVSVTYGAGGTTRDLTHDLVVRIKRETSLDPVPHLTCVCHSEADIAAIIERYAQAGVSNILALGGDPPRNLAAYDRTNDAFQHAADLVSFIVKFGGNGSHADPRGFGIGV